MLTLLAVYIGRQQQKKFNLSLSQLRPISSYFAPQATAGSTSAAVCYNIPGPASASCSSEALLVYSSDCDDDDCAREPGDCYYDGVTADISHDFTIIMERQGFSS